MRFYTKWHEFYCGSDLHAVSHGAQLVAGVRAVSGVECMLVANDPTVKGGASNPWTVKKIFRASQIAEENGLIAEIGLWVLMEATRQLRAWDDAGLDVPAGSVNCSVRQLDPDRLPAQLRILVEDQGAAHQREVLAQQAEADAKLAWTTAENVRVQRALQSERSPR